MPGVLPKVAILCGGRGTRLQAHSPSLPKPLVEIGGEPILWHVIQIYLAQGFRRFVLRQPAKFMQRNVLSGAPCGKLGGSGSIDVNLPANVGERGVIILSIARRPGQPIAAMDATRLPLAERAAPIV